VIAEQGLSRVVVYDEVKNREERQLHYGYFHSKYFVGSEMAGNVMKLIGDGYSAFLRVFLILLLWQFN